MKGACVFVFFMIFNAILGLKGIGIIIFGVLSMSLKRRRRLSVELRTLSLNDRLAPFIALMVIGSYITIIFILGAFSKNKRGINSIFCININFNNSRHRNGCFLW